MFNSRHRVSIALPSTFTKEHQPITIAVEGIVTKIISRIVLAVVVSVGLNILGAPVWAAVLGGLIVSFQVFPENP